MRTWLSSLTVSTLLVVACASTPPASESAAKDKPPPPTVYGSGSPGPNPVGAIPRAVLRDASRNKDVELAIDYPTRGGPHPVIVFSHGFGTSGTSYVPLSSFWASHGYVVVRPRHADFGVLREVAPPPTRRDAERPRRRERRERNREQTPEEIREARRAIAEAMWEGQNEAEWRNRVRDVVFAIDSLQQLEQTYPELAGRIDRERVVVGGHSYGAFTALLLGGMTPFLQGTPLRMSDPRVKAVMAMSPQGPAERLGLTAESWRDVKVPVLFLTGSRDEGFNENETPTWRREAFEGSAPGDKYFISIEGARHATFTGRYGDIRMVDPMDAERIGITDPRDPRRTTRVEQPRTPYVASFSERELFESVKRFSVAFWDAYAKGESRAKEYLTSLSGANFARK